MPLTNGGELVKTISLHLIKTLERPDGGEWDIDVAELLFDLLHRDIWQRSDDEFLSQLSIRLNISGKLFTGYDKDWKNPSEKTLNEPWNSLAILLLYRVYLAMLARDDEQSVLLKQMNTLLKFFELPVADMLDSELALHSCILKDYQCLLQSVTSQTPTIDVTRVTDNIATTVFEQESTNRKRHFETLPLTFLFYEGPIARAYLETLYLMGYKPHKIIQLVPSIDIASKKPVGRILPGKLRMAYAENLQKNKIHYWPRKLQSTAPELYEAIRLQVEQSLMFPRSVLDARELAPLTKYCDEIKSLLITGLRDIKLHEFLLSEAPATLLYSGGGIVPASLLEIDGLNFIHVHPGYLPDIRGADCVLWSILMSGHASASSFYMSPGIDAGDVIKSCWLPRIKFGVDVSDYDIKTLYRSVYSFFDPWVRAYVLRETIKKGSTLFDSTPAPQDEGKGTTFHFMAPLLQKNAFEYMLK